MEKRGRGRPADSRDLDRQGFRVRLPKQHVRILRRRAEVEGVPVAEVFRELVAQYVEKK